MITPERVRTLVPIVLANAGDIPVEFHTHCLTGLGALSTLEAIDAEQATVIYGVPTMFVAELQHPEFGRFQMNSLRTGAQAEGG